MCIPVIMSNYRFTDLLDSFCASLQVEKMLFSSMKISSTPSSSDNMNSGNQNFTHTIHGTGILPTFTININHFV